MYVQNGWKSNVTAGKYEKNIDIKCNRSKESFFTVQDSLDNNKKRKVKKRNMKGHNQEIKLIN